MVQNGNLQNYPMFSLQYYHIAMLFSLQTYLTEIFQLLRKGGGNTVIYYIPLIIMKRETNFTSDFLVNLVVLVFNSFFFSLYKFILSWNFMSYIKDFFLLSTMFLYLKVLIYLYICKYI